VTKVNGQKSFPGAVDRIPNRVPNSRGNKVLRRSPSDNQGPKDSLIIILTCRFSACWSL